MKVIGGRKYGKTYQYNQIKKQIEDLKEELKQCPENYNASLYMTIRKSRIIKTKIKELEKLLENNYE